MNTLILTGGKSRRMGRDKAGIVRPDGRRQIEFLSQLAQDVGGEVYLSLSDEAPPIELPVIRDRFPGSGPLAALDAAAHAAAGPWLVLGVDLFLMDAETLRHLLGNFDSARLATSYKNRLDARAEPLCTIYHEDALRRAEGAISRDERCARRFLESLDPLLLDLPNPAALENANTPEELDEVFRMQRDGVHPKPVRILYFAKLREASGLGEELFESLAANAAGLYRELAFRHRFSLEPSALRVAINGDFASWDQPLRAGDEVVFIPPVAGG